MDDEPARKLRYARYRRKRHSQARTLTEAGLQLFNGRTNAATLHPEVDILDEDELFFPPFCSEQHATVIDAIAYGRAGAFE